VPKRILYADNDRPYLEGRSEFLEDEGFQVIKAFSPEQVEQALDRENIHLAILDIRLVDDNDDRDVSGFLLAKNERYKRIPKIFVTGFPSFEAVRDAYGAIIGEQPIAQAFLSKEEGPDALVDALNSVFEKVVGINWDLQIEWDEMGMLSFRHLALLFDDALDPSLLDARSGELEDLIRKLFARDEHITITRLNWLQNGCACLTLFAHKNDTSHQMILILGSWETVKKQFAQMERYLEVESVLFTKPTTTESHHYAAFAWTIPQAGTYPLQTGPIFLELAGDRQIRTALESLYQGVLTKWHQHEHAQNDQTDLAKLYRERLDIPVQTDSMKRARLAIQELSKRAQSQFLVKEIFMEGNEIGIILQNDSVYRGPNPFIALFDPLTFKKHPTMIASTFGGMTSQSLLVDQDGRAFPTDFSGMTRSPVLEDFISFECDFRFDRIGSTNLISLYDFEFQIGEIKTLSGLTAGIGEPDCRRALTVIQVIRKLATEFAGDALEPYLIGLFHYAMKSLLVSDLRARQTKQQTSRLVHRLLAASMLITQIARLGDEQADPRADLEGTSSLVIDINRRRVTLNGKEIHLTQTEFRLLSYLYEHSNCLCKRDDILLNVFDIKSKPSDSDRSLLNTNIDRLRRKIDINPAKHRYIVNIRGEGYRLDLAP